MRILVTGAGGQLGRELRRLVETETGGVCGGDGAPGGGLVGRDHDWIFADSRRLDVTNPEAVAAFWESRRPDAVINCAAFTDVDGAEAEKAKAFAVNRDGPRFLAHASARTGALLLHVSTDFVFDGRSKKPYTETDTPAPLNVYGESKLAGERAVLESGCRGAVVRTSWLYSPWGRNFVKSILTAATNAVSASCARSAVPKPELRVVADQIGRPTSAASLAAAIVKIVPPLMERNEPAALYHYCDAGDDSRAAGGVSRAEFAAEIVRKAGLDCRVVPISSAEYAATRPGSATTATATATAPATASRPEYSTLDTSKITRDLGVVPPAWRDALEDCIKLIYDGR
ncbi:MAG: dTDP-4-dehydrorhamnose reductase [Alistipes sp.]|nr:dTDP-4-dehydrorhamnose reductase [Alistipes sp.]